MTRLTWRSERTVTWPWFWVLLGFVEEGIEQVEEDAEEFPGSLRE
jgi:hypothetical protein